MAVNPDAVAWYLRRSEAVLEDHRERVAARRGRAGQLAGFSGAVLTLAGANAETVLASLHGAARSGAGIVLLVGSALLIAASFTALGGPLAPRPVWDLSTSEVANYATWPLGSSKPLSDSSSAAFL
jgi:hypothetical protein